MNLVSTNLDGCFVIEPNSFYDSRGLFNKTFNKDVFDKNGLCSEWVEEYYSISNKKVIRGLHFQLPPNDHCKLVYCTSGKVFDVVLDLRSNSNTFCQFFTIELSAEKKNQLYIPEGMAHGFCALEDHSTMIYKTSTVYSKDSDSGILWDSAGIEWPFSDHIISSRDKSFCKLKDFNSPFL